MGRHRKQRRGPSRRQVIGGGVLLVVASVLTGSTRHVGLTEETKSQPATADTVFTRADWHAREPERSAEVLDEAPTYVVIHHTDTRNTDDVSRGWAFELSRAIQNHHMESFGWPDAGQQLTISRGGYAMEGRAGSLDAINNGQHLVGTQARDHNPVAIGIENEGRYHETEPPSELYASLTEVCAWLCTTYELPVSAIVGHRDLVNTTCPGDALYEMLPDLRQETEALIDAA